MLRYVAWCAAPLANGVHMGKLGRNGKQSGSCNSSGLLSHHIRGGVPDANGNGNGYSSRHSSELSVDDDWEPRPPSSSNFSKVSCSFCLHSCHDVAFTSTCVPCIGLFTQTLLQVSA